MAFYFNGEDKNFILNGVIYWLHVNEPLEIVEGVKMKSSDGYILTDANGMYITLKEVE